MIMLEFVCSEKGHAMRTKAKIPQKCPVVMLPQSQETSISFRENRQVNFFWDEKSSFHRYSKLLPPEGGSFMAGL